MIISAIAALTVAATPPDYDTRYFEIRELSNAEGCVLVGDWELAGRSTIYVNVELETDGGLGVAASSHGWSNPSPDAIKMIVLGLNASDGTNEVFALAGVPTRARPGLVGLISEDKRGQFLEAFASRQTLFVYFADIPKDGQKFKPEDLNLVLQAGLTGSSEAVSSLRRCVSDVKRREDERRAREARVGHITKDPFSD